jgi:hypothetical protein
MADDRPEPWLPSTTSDCPVDAKTQEWMESSIRWFLGQFGTSVIYRDPVLPTAGLLSGTGYSASVGEIEELIAHLCELMLVDSGSFTLELYDGAAEKDVITASGKSHAVGHFRMTGGRLAISLDQRETSDPRHLTAIAVHELCHLRLLGEGRIRNGRSDGERLTDLLTVYFGFGIFTTNAAMSFTRAERGFTVVSRGLLDDRTLNAAKRNEGYQRLGYALACYCWVRGETEPPGWRGTSIPARAFTWNVVWLTSAARPDGPHDPTLRPSPLSTCTSPRPPSQQVSEPRAPQRPERVTSRVWHWLDKLDQSAG